MESPVVVDKPPEYHGVNERGFPFDEEEGAGAWSELAARHPDIAARLRQRPATWARKRRPSSQDATDDFGDTFGGFDRFPFDDIPSEFREHFPSHWNRRFGSRDEPQPQSQASPPTPPQPPPQPQQQTAATQTELDPPVEHSEHTQIPQYGLRNTVDLGQKSPADPSVVDAEERTQRSVSAPPESRPASQPAMSHDHPEQPSNVRHIPIFVEGRDEPVINKSTHFGEPKPQYAPPPPQPHIDRDQYFADDTGHGFHHPPNFSRAFGSPFPKGYRQGPQPFTQQKVYPQTAFTRGASPQRSQSPKPQPHSEEYVKVPVHHDQPAAKPDHPPRAQQKTPQPTPQPPPPQREATPPHPPQPSPNDPITLILSIQTDVLNLMTEVENFAGAKNDKNYLFLDEMLTRNLIKLDNVETDGKENIRQARKEAIKCIQKCIAVLEAKAESNSNKAAGTPQPVKDEEMNGSDAPQATENGEVEMKEATDEVKVEPQVQPDSELPQLAEPQPQVEKIEEQSPQVDQTEVAPETKEAPKAADTRPDVKTEQPSVEIKDEVNKPEENVDKKSPKKATKPTKKRDKSKDKKETGDSSKDTSKQEMAGEEKEKKEVMQLDDKGDKVEQGMEVDGAASQ